MDGYQFGVNRTTTLQTTNNGKEQRIQLAGRGRNTTT